MRRAEDNPLLCQRLGDDRRYHCPGGLPRAVGVEWPYSSDRNVERPVETLSQLVSSDLARGVGGLPLEWVVLIDRDVTRRSVDLTRGGMNYFPDAGISCRLKDVERTEDVRLNRLPGMDVGVRDRDE